MARKIIVYIIILLLGLAGGIGIGFLMTQKQAKAANTTIKELQDQQDQTKSDLENLNKKLSERETALTQSRNNVMRKNTELLRAQTELARMKKVLDQALQGQTASPTQPSPTLTSTAVRTPTRAPLSAGVREYTIKDGDSFWKIAANELGNGIRYKDILALNPGMNENTTLTVGEKIRIPAR